MRLTPIAARPIAPPSPAALPEPSVPPSPAAGQGAQTDLTQLPLPLSIASQIPARARKPERLPGQQGQQEQAAAKSDHDAPYDWHDSPSCDDGDDDWRRDGASSRRVRRHDGSGCETLTSPRLLPGNIAFACRFFFSHARACKRDRCKNKRISVKTTVFPGIVLVVGN